jgi:hypothetical protein
VVVSSLPNYSLFSEQQEQSGNFFCENYKDCLRKILFDVSVRGDNNINTLQEETMVVHKKKTVKKKTAVKKKAHKAVKKTAAKKKPAAKKKTAKKKAAPVKATIQQA